MVISVSFFISCDRSGFTDKNKVKLSDEMQNMLNALLDGDHIVEAEPFLKSEDNEHSAALLSFCLTGILVTDVKTVS